MSTVDQSYSHVVEIDEGSGKIALYRLLQNGKREPYTSVDVPDTAKGGKSPEYEQLIRDLGENILLDSPSARRLLRL